MPRQLTLALKSLNGLPIIRGSHRDHIPQRMLGRALEQNNPKRRSPLAKIGQAPGVTTDWAESPSNTEAIWNAAAAALWSYY